MDLVVMMDLGWSEGRSACDKYIISNGETIFWYYLYTYTSISERIRLSHHDKHHPLFWRWLYG